MPNYPASLDTTGAGTLPSNHADNISEIIHAADIDNHSLAIVSLETKLGTGVSTPTNGLTLVGGVTAGSSAWQTPVGGPPTGSASGGTSDLTGTYPQPTVARVNGIAITGTPVVGQVPTATGGTAATWQTPTAGGGTINGVTVTGTPATGQVPTATSTTTATWQASAGGPPSGSAAGGTSDLSGTYPQPTVARINGVAVTGTPSFGQVPTATGTTAATWQTPAVGGGSYNPTWGGWPVNPSVLPGISLQSLVSGGGTINIPAGVYREMVTLPNLAATITFAAGASLRGSDVWTDWVQVYGSTTLFKSAKSVPVWSTVGPDNIAPYNSAIASTIHVDGWKTLHPEQVFFDGKWLTQVPDGIVPEAGQFALDQDRHVILADDPVNHIVEVTVRTQVLTFANGANAVTLNNWDVRHSGSTAQHGMVVFGGQGNITIAGGFFGWCSGVAITGFSPGPVSVTGCEIYQCGHNGFGMNQQGMGTKPRPASTFSNMTVHALNTYGFASIWEAGNKFWYTDSVTCSGNTIYDGAGMGIWFDNLNTQMTVQNNKIHHIESGIVMEISGMNGSGAEYGTRTDISNNSIWECGWSNFGLYNQNSENAILINSSCNANIHDNYIAWNISGITVNAASRTDSGQNLEPHKDVRVYNNYIIQETGFAAPAAQAGAAMSFFLHNYANEVTANGTTVYDSDTVGGYSNHFYYLSAEITAGWSYAYSYYSEAHPNQYTSLGPLNTTAVTTHDRNGGNFTGLGISSYIDTGTATQGSFSRTLPAAVTTAFSGKGIPMVADPNHGASFGYTPPIQAATYKMYGAERVVMVSGNQTIQLPFWHQADLDRPYWIIQTTAATAVTVSTQDSADIGAAGTTSVVVASPGRAGFIYVGILGGAFSTHGTWMRVV